DEAGEFDDAREQRDRPVSAGSGRRDAPGDAERGDVHPPQREPGRDRSGGRDSDRDDEDVGDAERQVAGEERGAGEGNRGDRRPEQEEQAEAGGHAGDRGRSRLDRGDYRDLPGRRAGQAHRGEALLPAGRGEPGGRGDEDEHREEQRQGHDREDQVDAVRVDADADQAGLAITDVRRGALDAAGPGGARNAGELTGGVADDDEQRVRGGQRRRADRADLASGESVAELRGRGRAQQLAEGR